MVFVFSSRFCILKNMPTPSQHAFSEKVALITDGANPVGRAVAMQLALYGSYVIVGFSGTNEEDKRAIEELKALGTLANAVETDISHEVGIKKMVDQVEGLYGRLDLLVNCVDFGKEADFESITGESFDELVNKTIKSSLFISRRAFPLMKKRPKPKIVNVISALDVPETEKNITLITVNQALIGLTKGLAKGFPAHFRVNAVAVSGKAKAPSKHDRLDPELFRIPVGVDPDDVARTILFLLSSEAIGINGQIIKVE